MTYIQQQKKGLNIMTGRTLSTLFFLKIEYTIVSTHLSN